MDESDADRRSKKRIVAKRMRTFRTGKESQGGNEARLTVLSDQANEEYILKKQLASVLNRSMQDHWNMLRQIPFRIMAFDKTLINQSENWFYMGVFMFFLSCLYFIIFGIVG